MNRHTQATGPGADPVAAVRRFNRFYTRAIGALDERLLDSPYSLAEVRVLYELAHRSRISATDLARELGLDHGYLSRILTRFTRQALIRREASKDDARRAEISLSRRGKAIINSLEQASRNEVAKKLDGLLPDDRGRLTGAMATIEALLAPADAPRVPYLLRAHRPGDIGWVIGRHAALYAQEYGWDQSFEALVADIGAQFLRNFNPRREACWIAERGGQNVGSVFIVEKSKRVAQLRMLIVEPAARGLGIGERLVAEAIDHSRRTGYKTVILWTNDILHAARRIYQRAGFRLVKEEQHESFGHALTGQYWELTL